MSQISNLRRPRGIGVQIYAVTLAIVVVVELGGVSRVNAVQRNQLFPFGESKGDENPFRNDDDSSLVIEPPVPFTFFGRQRSRLFVNNNGLITFTNRLAHFSDHVLPWTSINYQSVAPFFGDVDTRGPAGELYYRLTSDPTLLRRADDIVRQSFVRGEGFASSVLLVATWDRVGHYERQTELRNTYQCVIATDGIDTYVIFFYVDIQWSRAEEDDNLAQAGFNAGDGIHYYRVPGTDTAEGLLTLANTSNVGIAGQWVFKVSGPSIEVGGCLQLTGNGRVPITVTPEQGDQLGGDLVSIQGPCFSERANIQCEFGGEAVVALYDTESVVHCATPRLSRSGRVRFRLLIDGVVRGEAFYTALSIESGHRVSLNISSPLPLLLMEGSRVTLNWSPEDVLPQVDPNSTPYNIDILLYVLNTDSAQWEEHSLLVDNILNNGTTIIDLPAGVTDDLVAMAFHVATSLNPTVSFNSELYRKLFRSRQRVGVWSSQYYYISPEAAGMRGRELCHDWFDEQPLHVPTSMTTGSTPCAPTLERARLPSSGLSEIRLEGVTDDTLYMEGWMNTFHPKASRCFKQAAVDTRSSEPPPEQECCYDDMGFLISGVHNGGSVKQVSAEFSRAQNFVDDIRPFFLCCTGQAPSCELYYSKRPSDNGSRFDPPSPGWMVGDPHMVTMDGLRYTFNGKGEFTLLETLNGSFTLQGRMETLPNIPQGTVFTAVAARVGGDGDRVMVGTSWRGVEVYVNGQSLDMSATSEHKLEEFTVTQEEGVVTVRFVNGVYLECRKNASQGDFLSTLVLSAPKGLAGNTQGLLGNFNGNDGDDLTPRGNATVAPLPADSDLRTIHDNFGLTWLIREDSQSLFTYLPYESLSKFSSPGYLPLLDLNLTNHVLVERCQSDTFCLFDSMVTGSASFAQLTLETVIEVNRTQEIVSQGPVTCDPACANGVCIPGNQCSCPNGFSGDRCQTAERSECVDLNPCSRDERCHMQAGSFICVVDCNASPSSELCTSTSTPPTLTIIIATVSVVGGTVLIIVVITIIIMLVVHGKRRRVSKVSVEESNTGNEGRRDPANTTPPLPLSQVCVSSEPYLPGTSDSLPKKNTESFVSGGSTDTFPLPRYSDLAINAAGDVPHEKMNGDILLTLYETSGGGGDSNEADYQNLPNRSSQPISGGMVGVAPRPGPQVRRSSVGAVTLGDAHKQGRSFQGSLTLPERAQSHHNVISISPDSEASGSPRERPQQYPSEFSNSSGQLRETTPPSHEDKVWYRGSTPSVPSAQEFPPTDSVPLPPSSQPHPLSQGLQPPHHRSLQHSFSNPLGQTRSQSSMGCPHCTCGGMVSNGMSRSQHVMPRSASSMSRSLGRSAQGMHRQGGGMSSIPADMDLEGTDV